MYGVYEHSHWQGSGPDQVVAVGSRESCERFAAALHTCSFCGGSSGGGYSVGRCLRVGRPRYVGADTPRLPDDLHEWDASDIAAWEADGIYADGIYA